MSETRAPEMLDRYELVAPLARGGMGTVHLARLPGVGGFQRLYAIKVMHPHLADEEQFVAMLLDEARLAARIHHPNAVAIVDICQGPQGFYLVMDYIDGVTLASALTAVATLPWKQRVELATRVILDALAGLHAAHELTDDDGAPLGIVHRDVSPQNILVGADGVGRITDFGIALAASRIAASRPGMIKGKPAYMAPEQITAGQVDRRADLFAIGIILWESLTGQRLFSGDTEMAVMMQVMSKEVPRPSAVAPSVPESLDEVCMWALSREINDRPATARVLSGALEAAAVENNLLASSHEVSELLAKTFRDDFAARRALIRDHARTSDAVRSLKTASSGTPRPATLSAPRVQPAIVGDELTLQTPTGFSGTSIPAIEVRTGAKAIASPPATELAHAPSVRPTDRRWVIALVAALVASGAVAGAVLTRHPDMPREAPRERPASPPASASTASVPTTAIAVPVAALPAVLADAGRAHDGAERAAVPFQAMADVPLVVVAEPVTEPGAAPGSHRAHGLRRGAREHREEPSLPVNPTQPSSPAIERNPYLQR